MKQSFIWGILGLTSLAVVVLPCCYAQDAPQDYLSVHNAARAAVNVLPLVWSDDLALRAQYALTEYFLLYLTEGFMVEVVDRVTIKVGDDTITGTTAVTAWVSEKENYDYDKNLCSGGPCTSYTQVVWNSTRSVGCSKAKCPDNNLLWAIACVYDPVGNIPGIRPY